MSSLSANLFTTPTTAGNNSGGGVLSALAQSNSLHQPLAQFNVVRALAVSCVGFTFSNITCVRIIGAFTHNLTQLFLEYNKHFSA